MEQFQLLHSKSQFCVAPTRALLLSTYIKWVNVFPEIKPQLLNIFERYRHVLDPELQQRACEFYALASRPDEDEFLQNVCEEMPPFPPRVSTLLGSLDKKHGDTGGDKRTWVHGGKDANVDHKLRKSTLIPALDDIKTGTNGASAAGAGEQDIMSALAGLDLTSPTTPAPDTAFVDKTPRLTVSPNIERWYEKLLYSGEGVLYEDIQIQIGIKSRYQAHIGQLAVYIGNKVDAPLTSFMAHITIGDSEALSASFSKIPPNTIAPKSQVQQLIQVECKKVFTTPPVLTISYLAGSHQAISLRLPIVLTKFVEHVKLGATEFFERWKLIGNEREAQAIFPIDLSSSGQLDLDRNRQIVSGHNLNVLDDIDPNLNNIVGAGVLHTASEGKVGCLLRMEPNREAKVNRLLNIITPVLILVHSFVALPYGVRLRS